MARSLPRFLVPLLSAWLAAGRSTAETAIDRPFLHPLFTDHAVLQREIPIPVWGWTTPGAQVTVALGGETARAIAGSDGRWQAKIGPFYAGGPHTLSVSGPQNATVKDVLVGDVWLCSGQSNMNSRVVDAKNSEVEIAQAKHPEIRFFTVPKREALEPADSMAAEWQVCSPAIVGNFSAVCYFFGRHLKQELHLPVGLIHASQAASVAESWTSAEALQTMADFRPQLEQLARVRAAIERGEQDRLLEDWYQSQDRGTRKGWQRPGSVTTNWSFVALPRNFERIGLRNFDGIVWFQKAFDAPAAWMGKELTLSLGGILDFDTTWVNGVKVGASSHGARVYKVPANVVTIGENVIAIRVLDTGLGGGLTSRPAQLRIYPVDDESSAVALAGVWRMRESIAYWKIEPVPPINSSELSGRCAVLYNGMIAPLLPFPLKGVIWYQGESNTARPYQYRTLLPTMIRDWRTRFSVGNFGFHIVSIANLLAPSPEPTDSQWAELREAQALVAKTVPNCSIAMAIDLGESDNLHPHNKQEVGRRLALSALANTYGQKIAWSGPWYRSMEIAAPGIRLTFDHVEGGLVAKDGPLKGFAVAGEDRKFVWAEAVIEGDTVLVSSPKVLSPVAVRYGWDTGPVCDLYNGAGLPAVPFRTDDWRELPAPARSKSR